MAPYNRNRDIPEAFPWTWPHELRPDTPDARLRLLIRMRRSVEAEAQRGLEGHWVYSPARHRGMLRVYEIERDALKAILAKCGL